MCKEDKDCWKMSCCCAEGPQGVAGDQGPQGIQGIQGAQGIMGLQGIQGPRGLQGVPGKDCDCDKSEVPYLNLYSNMDQSIDAFSGASDFVKFEKVNAFTADFDFSLASTLGIIKFLKAGDYEISWAANGMLSPPFPAPVPSWGMALYINGLLVGGSAVAGFSQSPDDDATVLSNEVIIKINAGDVMKLVNVATSAVFLKSNHPELVVPMTSADICISMIS